ncbi:TonB-dependent copper receptor [Stutzerimonas kirkiae]|uniref:TonB-dependent copper receptor n=1 Tax=Stutzerimonas kirkiae TaxID=2211392 RepID=UPI00103845F8|nr:TonB-dependent copper receptor [Stutzerimonas kirkiae]TBV09818.1 TonB-dependent copper receptor [Stutzerimonas kirkiae]TBV13452.1 TonB-dependent copper receptor [Stutzerimonas kirkiae]
MESTLLPCPNAMGHFEPAATFIRWRQAFAISLGLLAVSPLHAHEHSPTSAELESTVITAVQQASPLTVVTNPKEPRQPVPATDGADYLKTIPGFSSIRNGGSNGDPVLRGMFGSRLNILSNGTLMIGACPSRMDAPTSYIVPSTFDRLTVIKGPQTVIWGAGSSAGTVLFERDPERFSELGGRVDASFLVGSNGRLDKVFDGSLGAEEGYLRVIGTHAQADDYKSGDGERMPSRWEKWSGDIALGWTPDSDTLIELSAGKGDGESRYAGRGMDATKLLRESLGLRVVRENIGDVLSKVEAQVYYNYADHIMDNYSLRTPNPYDAMPMMRYPMASNVDRRTVGARVAATFDWDTLQVIAGLDAMRSEHRGRRSSYAMMSGAFTGAGQFPRVRDALFHNYGVFTEATWRTDEQQRLIGGARLDRASAKDYRQTLGSMMPTINPTLGDSRDETLPSGFLRYEIDLRSQPTTLYAGLGHSQRMPDYWELFSPGSGPLGSRNAFDAIHPEKTTQFDFGVQYAGDELQAWASGYLGQIRDYILFTYTPGMMGTTSRAQNIDARIMGVELGASYRLDANWKGDATLAYAWGKNRSDGEALPQMPPLEVRLGLTYERSDWSAGALWRVVAAQNRIAEGRGNVVGKDFDDSPGFAVFSLNGAYRVSRQVRLSAGIDNLFDRDYTEHLNLAGNAGFGFVADNPESISEPGRTLWTKVDISF